MIAYHQNSMRILISVLFNTLIATFDFDSRIISNGARLTSRSFSIFFYLLIEAINICFCSKFIK